ncbi:PD-(D/E)XK nuclease family protein [Kitasatospora sp. NPDC059146]|uniref:PD-(D/E)XK nuclease family protein n=1 Tax=Kitasatospora sp. NPDC059146 TaxID=3346741 RepID=UPI0036A33FAF
MAPFMTALDLIEHQDQPVDQVIEQLFASQGAFGYGPPAHPSLLDWTAQAITRFVAARRHQQASTTGVLPTHPLRNLEWVAFRGHRTDPDDLDTVAVREYTAWGRRYESADGSLRELWLPSYGKAKQNRSVAEQAAIAHVLFRGVPSRRPPFGKPCARPDDSAFRSPDRVRVYEFGCAAGDSTLLLDWSTREAAAAFAAHTTPLLARAETDIATRPGPSCTDCKAIEGCRSLRRAEGLWPGTPSPQRSRRDISAWDLRTYRSCPARYHLERQLNLRSAEDNESEETRRGRAVDAWLNERHSAGPGHSCRYPAGPEDPDDWEAGGHRLTGRIARQATAMLGWHRTLCPLGALGPEEKVLVQHTSAVLIPSLGVVLIATPDLLYTRDGGWFWRETKTVSRLPGQGVPLMRRYPQLAVAVMMLASRPDLETIRRSRVELELLHEDSPTLEQLDPSRPDTVEEARLLLAELAEPLLHDTRFAPTPGSHCADCPARAWCRSGTEHLAERASREPIPPTRESGSRE